MCIGSSKNFHFQYGNESYTPNKYVQQSNGIVDLFVHTNIPFLVMRTIILTVDLRLPSFTLDVLADYQKKQDTALTNLVVTPLDSQVLLSQTTSRSGVKYMK
jgi:hypothetical protein